MNIVFETGNEGVVINKLRTLKPGKYTVDIKKHRQLRSLSQNKYYRGVVIRTLAVEIGDLDEAIHELMKRKFLTKIITFPNGEEEIVGGSTADLDTKEMSLYIESIRNWAMNEQGIHIPTANAITEDMLLELSYQYERMILG